MEVRKTGRWKKQQGEIAAQVITGNGGAGAGNLCRGLVTAVLKKRGNELRALLMEIILYSPWVHWCHGPIDTVGLLVSWVYCCRRRLSGLKPSSVTWRCSAVKLKARRCLGRHMGRSGSRGSPADNEWLKYLHQERYHLVRQKRFNILYTGNEVGTVMSYLSQNQDCQRQGRRQTPPHACALNREPSMTISRYYTYVHSFHMRRDTCAMQPVPRTFVHAYPVQIPGQL